ncbi:hypothetical protein FGO68_gene4833 [Halteria grandinella]|uniref:Glutathione S-transferase n=1 Tax=Halteria grandinella TaxID=5974 RepID=A0A8J8NJ68_HALGN|nr:hypothetical protein FGO68_gene4833 [Halteria grandinella]
MYKIYYLDFFGRSECMRLLFDHFSLPYTDVVLTQPDLQALKLEQGKLEFGQVPVIETPEGAFLCQSLAILRYLGRKYGAYPESDAHTAYLIDSTIDGMEDYINHFFKYHMTPQDHPLKSELREKWLSFSDTLFSVLEKRQPKEAKYFLGCENITIADFALAAFIYMMVLNEANPHYEAIKPVWDKHEGLHRYAEGLYELFKTRFESRGKKPF